MSCLPVVTLGFGAALTHLLHAAGTVADVPDDMAEDVPGPVSVPMLDEAAGTVAVTPGPVADAVVDAVPTPQARATARTVARGRTRRHSPEQRAERAFAGHLEAGSLPSLRAIMRDIKVGQDKARSIRAHLATVAASNRQVANG